MSTLRVLSPGITTVQDKGRLGWQHVGVPTSGAWNSAAYEEACLLLSSDMKDRNIPMFEVLAGAFRFLVEGDPVYLTCVGSATLLVDGQPMPTGALLTTQRPHTRPVEVEVHHTGNGVAYLAVAGLTVPSTLGSCSTDTFSRLGPDPVKKDDEFLLATDSLLGNVGKFLRPVETVLPSPIRVISHHTSDILFSTSWTVQVSSRSGTRLTSVSSVTLPSLTARSSHPVAPGVIQLPPNGEPIILGPDSGVTGGYPTVGTVITADLPRIAGLQAGSRLVFQPCSVEEAMIEHTRLLTRMNNGTIDVSYIQQMTSKHPKVSKKTKR